jgi:molecular chaperone DnaJ
MGGRMKFNITCPRCNGTGRIRNDCSTCHGEGVVSRTETVEFRIKPGTRDGQRIRLQGKGNAGVNGGAPATCSSSCAPARTRSSRARATIFTHRARHRCRGLAGRQGRRAHHRRPRAVEDSARHAERAKAAHAGARRGERAAAGQRGDEIVTVRSWCRTLNDERSREIMRELAKLNNQTRAWRCLTSCKRHDSAEWADSSTTIYTDFPRLTLGMHKVR